jgi:hypothetical protein
MVLSCIRRTYRVVLIFASVFAEFVEWENLLTSSASFIHGWFSIALPAIRHLDLDLLRTSTTRECLILA